MTKGEIIYRTVFVVAYAIFMIMNIKAAINQAQWLGFAQGVAVSVCIVGLVAHITKLVKGKAKED